MTFFEHGCHVCSKQLLNNLLHPPRGVFFLFKLEGCALKVGGVTPPLGGSRNIPVRNPFTQSKHVLINSVNRLYLTVSTNTHKLFQVTHSVIKR